MQFHGIDIARYYYYVKPLIPRRLQISMRRSVAARTRQSCKDTWPIDREAGMAPDGWQGWHDNKKFALVLTHDVDTFKGHEKCHRLMQLEMDLGFRSSFNFVSGEYKVSSELRHHLTKNGFEVGVHGWFHNNKLYESKETFQKHAVQINKYLQEWETVGFRSPCMYHNLDWISELNIKYDASTFDTDPFEPQPDGMRTIFPFVVNGSPTGRGYVELPYTLPQDFTLFILLGEMNIDIWKNKLDWIAERGGMALVNTHPDYMKFEAGKPKIDAYPSEYYEMFLKYVKSKYADQYWHALPMDMAHFWLENYSPITQKKT